MEPSGLEILEIAMNRRILLVDDELAIRLTLKAILEMNGFEVETASSAHEAVQKMSSGIYEMVITDLCMETKTAGYDVIRAARRQAYNPATAILTAYSNLGNDWISQGAQTLLVKAMNPLDLLRQIEALLVMHQDSKSELLLTEMVNPAPRHKAAAADILPKAG
jgi:DNA-binding response OmpR family regulator